jgi:hypothetical protein
MEENGAGDIASSAKNGDFIRQSQRADCKAGGGGAIHCFLCFFFLSLFLFLSFSFFGFFFCSSFFFTLLFSVRGFVSFRLPT